MDERLEYLAFIIVGMIAAVAMMYIISWIG